jgi:hypothetical protein
MSIFRVLEIYKGYEFEIKDIKVSFMNLPLKMRQA